MMDRLSKQQRSVLMSKIRSRNTKPEKAVYDVLISMGFEYQPKMYGKPDYASKELEVAIFIDGCFWHGCYKHFRLPKTNQDFWKRKIVRNILRDFNVTAYYKKRNWWVIRVWEHSIPDIVERLRDIESVYEESFLRCFHNEEIENE